MRIWKKKKPPAPPTIPSAYELKQILAVKEQEKLQRVREKIATHFRAGRHPFVNWDIYHPVAILENHLIDKLESELKSLGYEVIKTTRNTFYSSAPDAQPHVLEVREVRIKE